MNEELLKPEEISAREYSEILFFAVDKSVYGIEIGLVEEIISMEAITVIPRLPDYIKGVINLRGKVVPVFSLRRRFGIEEIPFDDRNCIVILSLENGTQAGFIIDRIREVMNIDKTKISNAPYGNSVNESRYIKSIIDIGDGEIKMLLDCDRVVGVNVQPTAQADKAAEEKKPE